MREDLTADIEQLTGRKVIAFMSTNHIDPDLAAELFILEPGTPTHGERSAADGAAPDRRLSASPTDPSASAAERRGAQGGQGTIVPWHVPARRLASQS